MAAPAASEEGISLQALSFEQLNQVKQGLEEEMQGLQSAIQQLKTSVDKLVISKHALDTVQKTPEGTRMLVPLTSSLYVPGETTTLANVLIDVGTGYYIEKSVPEAQAFLDRKIALIKEQGVTVQQTLALKNQNLQQTQAAMREKLYDAQQKADKN
mmetsp:Transcript_40023/g.66405  ORF Transcript_40023/g.66405 Transcript_40023/m.66405 type:complete len:156 (+) Transcript_40023:52-519(+)|eukprot:CAMPEP_0119309734 /NCGR_PEP_ID=MMETSP1333-20130426/16331_1 /TAXON_ID=418940 /ORGANISM="Scyphosphaera apsteinii, Strain RCC1455" /LENGTH=155 /DNA_ID=CAMNT_0007313747 /DNA_START=43 /DNA_END=510 /DNA_ORIENTATION=+